MNKKKLRIVALTSAAALAAVIGIGTAVRLSAKENYDYRKKVLEKDSFEFHGELLQYVEPEPMEEHFHEKYGLPLQITYKDGSGLYYRFEPDTQKLRFIENKALADKEYAGFYAEDIKPYSDSDELLSDAKERIGEWFDGNAEDFEWKCEYNSLGYTDCEMQQVVNGGFTVTLGCVSYDMDGNFQSMSLSFDAMLNGKERSDVISKAEAIDMANAYLEEKYGETEWEEISASCGTAGNKNYWSIEFVKNGGIIEGYFIDVDILTGEITREGRIK